MRFVEACECWLAETLIALDDLAACVVLMWVSDAGDEIDEN